MLEVMSERCDHANGATGDVCSGSWLSMEFVFRLTILSRRCYRGHGAVD
jgi:hypothetical protein